jgi:HD-GYP domain-containing protein (c-di-GMP phosphodiesterase class II)
LKANELDLGSRILAISDMFTALTEERPYRSAMSLEKAIGIIKTSKGLDDDVKYCLYKNLEEINEIRRVSQENIFTSCHEIFNSKNGFINENSNFLKRKDA